MNWKRWTIVSIVFTVGLSCAQDPTPHLLVIVKDGRYGFIDESGTTVLKPKYLWASDFGSEFASVYVCSKYVAIDKIGGLHPASVLAGSELIAKSKNGKHGFINNKGEWKIPPQFENVLPFSEGLAAVEVHGDWGFVDESGALVIPPQFGEAYYFMEGVGHVQFRDPKDPYKLEHADTLIDRQGNVIIRDFTKVGLPSEGLVSFRDDSDHVGYYDLKGNIAIPPAFDEARDFSEGLAAVKKGSKWGYIDHGGNVIIPFRFDEAWEFAKGIADVKEGETRGFIDHSGNYKFHHAFEHVVGFQYGDPTRFWDKGLFGYLNSEGRVIWGPTRESPDHPPIFEDWSPEAKRQSCADFTQAEKTLVDSFPN